MFERYENLRVKKSGIGNKSVLLTALATASCLFSFLPWEQSQAQLILNAYPSQDNTNQTLWIFSGSSSSRSASAQIRNPSATNTDNQDTWQIDSNNGNIFDANKPSDTSFQLSPLFSSSNPKDIASVRARIPGGGKTNITFLASATNTPTLTIGSGSGVISHLFLDEDASGIAHYDDFGLRISGGFNYGTGASSWVGAGLVSKPIGDFFVGTFNNRADAPFFAGNSVGSVRVIVNSQIIPEPEEYALVLGLFALAFVLVHRRRMRQKRPRQASTS